MCSLWSADKGGWSISSSKVNVDSLTSGDAVLLASPDLDIVNYSVEVTFPSESSTNKAGLILCHDGNNSYYAVVLDRDAGKLALHKVTSGSWGSALESKAATIGESTYTIKVFRRQFSVRAWVVGQSATDFTYESSTDFGTGQSGLYSDKTSVTFDDFTAYDGTVRDSLVPRFVGPVDASISSGSLRVQTDSRGGQAMVEGFSDDNYMVQVNLGNPDNYSQVWFRYRDANNGYVVRYSSLAKLIISLHVVANGQWTELGSGGYTILETSNLAIKANGSSIQVWYGGNLKFDVTNSAISAGGVAFGADYGTFDNLKIGYDNTELTGRQVADRAPQEHG